MKRLLLILSLACSQFLSHAQSEVLLPISSCNGNTLKSEAVAASNLKSLPFFDDFAYPYSKPLPALWADDNAFVNTGFAKNMPTIGVATLDAMDANGKLYESVGTTASVADYLTSVPLNLKYYEKVYLSDKLYRKQGGSFALLDDTYYLYDADQKQYVSVKQRIAYVAGDTVYKKVADSFSPVQDSLYDEGKKYIKGSYSYEHQQYEYTVKDSLALSFYYQAGGLVDVPEANDSLVLEWYIPYDTTGIFLNEIASSGVEIYNATPEAVSLDGYILVFDALETVIANDSLSFFTLSGVQIPSFGHYVVTPSMFGRKAFNRAYAYLYTPEQVLVDSIDLKQSLAADISYARLPDGNPQWSFTASPTLGDCNPSWKWAWSTSKKTGNDFVSVYIPLDDKMFLVQGLRFRFKNYASLSNDESHARNEDFWHLDMIWLDANRTSSQKTVADVAFAAEFPSLYSRYKALPMKHFAQVYNSDFRMTIPATFTNFDTEYRKLKFHLAVDKRHVDESVTFDTYETDMPPQKTVTERDILTDFDIEFYDFIAEDIDVYEAGVYDFTYYYTDINNSLNSQYRWNDTCRVSLTLSNYYAYDDGTPEAGYGLREAPMGRVAYRFDMLQSDTIKAVSMYFNPTKLVMATTFNLCIWANENGMPGELLYYSPSEKVAYADGMYQFVDYEIKPSCIVSGAESLVLPKSYFIGWEQPNDVLLNIGIDLNTSVTRRLYYNLGFEWESSVQTGALLLRPIVGKYESKTAVEEVCTTNSIKVIPTIATSQIEIVADAQVKRVAVVNLQGKVVKTTNSNTISVSDLENGNYIVVVATEQGIFAQQIVVVK
ncbi:MAG: T9SS type A sorting domain-containing protein [Bacteroidales bacterium]|nr:T9SS type A sorting domain-containing protein [Bacteroidales bacterium]